MSRLLSSRLLVFAALFGLAFPALAGVGLWTPLGPDGGFVTALAVDPADPGIVYAGTRGSGVFKSTDGGESWTLAGRGLGTPIVAAVAVDPARHQIVYAATLDDGVFKSIDGGALWARIWAGVAPAPGTFGSTYALAVDPRRPDTVYAGTLTGVYRSTDGGATWSRRGNLPGVFALALDSAGGWLYAGTEQGVFRSFDQGKTWAPASNGLPSRQRIESLALDPEQPKTLLAATFSGLYRSVDRGKRWQAVGPVGNAAAVAFQRRGRAYAAFYSALYRSTDHGATWQASPPVPVFSFSALAAGPATVYAGSSGSPDGGGLFRSLDAGATWERSESGLLGLTAWPVAIDPSDSRTLFVVVNQVSLFKSTDRGATWTVSYPGSQRPFPTSIADILLDPAEPGRIYLAVSNEGPLQRSNDDGETWERLNGPTVPGLSDLALDPRAPGALWGTGVGRDATRGLFHSADGGVTWESVLTLSEGFTFVEHVEVDPRDPRIVYTGGGSVTGTRPVQFAPRLFRSADGGATWERRDAGITAGSVRDIALDPADPAALYAVTDRLFRTTDGGVSWSLPAGARGLSFISVAAAPAGPGTPATVYAARQDPPAVLRSTDRGASWTLVRQGLGSYIPLAVEVDPNDPATLYLGTSNGGLWTYTAPSP